MSLQGMALVIAIICIILIVVFWRLFRPIALVAGFGLGFLIVYSIHEYGQNQHQRMMAEQAVRERIASAKASAGEVRRKWQVQRDPASTQEMPRYASVLSDGGLCRLQVEVRIDGSRPTAIDCSGLKIDPSKDIEIKFDHRSTSDTMGIERFSDGDSVYIPSSYNNQLSYDEFLRRLAGANKVSLLLSVEEAGQHWITFSLKGSRSALAKIGAL